MFISIFLSFLLSFFCLFVRLCLCLLRETTGVQISLHAGPWLSINGQDYCILIYNDTGEFASNSKLCNLIWNEM